MATKLTREQHRKILRFYILVSHQTKNVKVSLLETQKTMYHYVASHSAQQLFLIPSERFSIMPV